MMYFLLYWYVQSPGRFYQALQSALAGLEGRIAVRDTLRNITQPLFKDYTLQGRLIGFGFRILRILFGLLASLCTVIAYIFLFLAWVVFPFLCLVSIGGSIFGSSLIPTTV